MKRRLAKRSKAITSEEEVKREIRKEVRKLEGRQLVDAVRDGHRTILPSEAHQLKRLLKQANYSVDIGYLKTVLFPEQFSYDIPLPLSSISYCRFTDKQEIHLTPGPNGSGMLVFYPRTNGGPALFYMPGGMPLKTGGDALTLPTAGDGVQMNDATKIVTVTSGTNVKIPLKPWQWGCNMTAWEHFTQTALIGASISMQYIGRVEYESGEIVGGHLHGIPLHEMNTEEIENSQWRYSGRPGDGFRALYLPKDSSDFEFYPTIPGTSYNQGGNPQPLVFSTADMESVVNRDQIDTANKSKQLGTEAQEVGDPISRFTIKTPVPTTADGEPAIALIGTVGQTGAASYKAIRNNEGAWKTVQTKLGTTTAFGNIAYVRNTSCIALYFQGMQSASTPQFRIDITRRFLGIPKSNVRDIVDLVRPQKNADPQKTFNALNTIAASAPIGCHSLKEIDSAIDPLMANIGNIGYMLDSGMDLPQHDTLAGFANGISDPRNMQGVRGDAPERLYKFYS